MSVPLDCEKKQQVPAHDEVDFSSGFETQYLQEYRPPKATATRPAPPDPSLAWYRNTMSIMMVCFLFVVLMTGSIFLIRAIFSSDPTTVVILLVAYLAVAFFFICLEVFSKHVR